MALSLFDYLKVSHPLGPVSFPEMRKKKYLFILHWYFVNKIVPTVRKKCSSDREKRLKFMAEGQEFAKCLRSLEQFIEQ